jgi:hypothetical protein
MASSNKTIHLEVSPETLRLIQYSLRHLARDLEKPQPIVISKKYDATVKKNVEGLYVQMGKILADALS